MITVLLVTAMVIAIFGGFLFWNSANKRQRAIELEVERDKQRMAREERQQKMEEHMRKVARMPTVTGSHRKVPTRRTSNYSSPTTSSSDATTTALFVGSYGGYDSSSSSSSSDCSSSFSSSDSCSF